MIQTTNKLIASILLVGLMMPVIGCEPADSTNSTDVEVIELAIENVRTDTLIVLDRSASMLGNGFLTEVATSLTDLTAAMDDYANFGLMVYPGIDCTPGGTSGQCSVPSEPYVLVDPEYSTAEEIAATFSTWSDGIGACGATPTAATLDAARSYMLNEVDTGNPSIILLITDGAPNCNDTLNGDTCECTAGDTCNDANSHLCLDDTASEDAAATLNEAGIPVYVLSLGDEVTPFDYVMDAIANKGGTDEALSAKVFADVAEKISQVQPDMYSCQIAVDWNALGELSKESKISTMAGKISIWSKESKESKESEIAYDPGCPATSGFDLTADNKISLCSSICNDLKESKISAMSATTKISKESKISATSKISLIH